jgi:hypothetical protein
VLVLCNSGILLTSIAYYNNTFKFASAYQGFPSSVRKGRGITASTPASPDGGKTWKIDQIVIPEYGKGNAPSQG